MGKTLLAKAVAGEAGVNFFSISASQFVEIYVGVGASRVRALYQEAKENVIFLFCCFFDSPFYSQIVMYSQLNTRNIRLVLVACCSIPLREMISTYI